NYKQIELSAESMRTKSGFYPDMTAYNVKNRGGNLVYASGLTGGALLKEYPLSSDYSIVYTTLGTGTSRTMRLDVYKELGTNSDGSVKLTGAGVPSTSP